MALIKKIPQSYLDNNAVWTPLRTVAVKLNEVIDALNGTTSLDLTANTLNVTSTTDATTKDTGAIITEGGIGVEKAVFAGTSITATTRFFSGNGTVALPAYSFINDPDSGIYRIGANNIGVAVNGIMALDVASTGLVINGALNVLTNTTFTKETNHTIEVSASTTAATAGGNLVIASGVGATSGNGGAIQIISGAGGATAGSTGGSLLLQSGASGAGGGPSGTTSVRTSGAALTNSSGAILIDTGATASADSGSISITSGQVSTLGASGLVSITTGTSGTSGATGAIILQTGNATIGSSGAINITSGSTASGVAGDINITTGTYTSTTVAPCVVLNKAIIHKPANTDTASGGTITGPQLVSGHITATGATGNWQLPTAAQITTAIGATPKGTWFDFVFNAASMTATNTATLVVGTNMTVMSAPAITGGGTLTVTQDTQVVGVFRVVFDSATTCKISRIA